MEALFYETSLGRGSRPSGFAYLGISAPRGRDRFRRWSSPGALRWRHAFFSRLGAGAGLSRGFRDPRWTSAHCRRDRGIVRSAALMRWPAGWGRAGDQTEQARPKTSVTYHVRRGLALRAGALAAALNGRIRPRACRPHRHPGLGAAISHLHRAGVDDRLRGAAPVLGCGFLLGDDSTLARPVRKARPDAASSG